MLACDGNQSLHARERSATRRRATTCVKTLEPYLRKEETEFTSDEADQLSFHVNQCVTVLDDLLAIRAHGEVDPPSQHIEELQFNLHRAKRRLSRVEGIITQRHQPPQPTPPAPVIYTTAPQMPTRQGPRFDVGRVHLNKFWGNPEDWTRFWNLFNIAVHSCTDYSPTEKFAHLLAHLEGPARRVIDGLPMTETNYPIAIDTLLERYNQPCDREQVLLSRLQSLEGLPSTLRAEKFEVFLDTCLISIRELESLGVGGEQHALFTLPSMESKLPGWMKERWIRSKPETPPADQLKAFVAFLKEEGKYLKKRQPHIGQKQEVSAQFKSQPRSSHNIGYASQPSYQPPYTPCYTGQPPDRPPHTPGYNTGHRPRPSGNNYALGISSFGNQGNPTPLSAGTPGIRPPGIPAPQQSSCPACKGRPHKFSDCATFMRWDAKQRQALLRNENRCFRCLGKRHRSAAECKGRSCNRCNQDHHTFLCSQPPTSQPPNNNNATLLNAYHEQPPYPQPPMNTPPDYQPTFDQPYQPLHRAQPQLQTTGFHQIHDVTMLNQCSIASEPCIFVKIVKTYISATDRTSGEWVHAYLDDGSHRSYIREDLAKRLGLPVTDSRQFTTSGFGGHLTTLPAADRVAFELSNMVGSSPIALTAWTAPRICAPIRQQKIPVFPLEWQPFQPLGDTYDGQTREISIIIGSDQIWNVTAGPVRHPNCPVFLDTYFGFVPTGPAPHLQPIESTTLLATDAHIQDLWALDKIVEEPEPEMELPQRVPGDPSRYMVALPFKGHLRPESNFHQAFTRSNSLCRSLSRTPDRLRMYSEKMKEMRDERIVEPATTGPDMGFFLPHHGVWKKKLRIVFDGSARDPKGQAFNNFLDTGPNLLLPVVDVITNSRLHPHLLLSDVKAAFLQVGIQPQDRHWLKFIWQGKHYQFTRVPFGLSCSPFLLNSTLRSHIRSSAPEHLKETLLRSLYVDDLTLCGPDHDELRNTFSRAVEIFLGASMELVEVENPTKILGVGWSPDTDELFVRSEVSRPAKLSRRGVLDFVCSIYDPLGILGPWTLEGRYILQQSWQTKLSWDEELPKALQAKFLDWIKNCESLNMVRVHRCLAWSKDKTTLHLFCDASSKAYAFVAYTQNPEEPARFLFSKSRLAPLRQELTIPQLELMAVLLAFRFFNHFVQHFGRPKRSFIWSDSSCVLAWLRSGVNRRQPFVTNRLSEIATLSQPDEMRFVPTDHNPADIPSRGSSIIDLHNSPFLCGPKFLRKHEGEWPGPPINPPQLAIIDPATPDVDEDTAEGEITNDRSDVGLSALLGIDRFSTLNRLVRIGAYVRRFISNLRKPKELRYLDNFLSYKERQDVFLELLREEQERLHPKEITRLREGSRILGNSPLTHLHPVLLDDLLYLKPRTNEPVLPILPTRSPLTTLVVQHHHTMLLHQGASTTLNDIRRDYWIPRGRSLVKQIIHRCPPCKRFRALPYQAPEGFLAPHRRSAAMPWSITGVDFFGPLEVVDTPDSSPTKAYCLLLTCGVIRSVHLELVPSLKATDAASAVRRFMNLRLPLGHPVTFHSDNGKTFLRLSRIRFTSSHPVEWKFIPARAPNWGGWWERLIRTIKHSLRVLIRNTTVTFQELQNHLVDISGVMNARPICPLSSDPRDTRALTPNHFLLPLCPSETPIDPAVVDDAILRGFLKRRDKMGREFWTRWYREYLSSLREWSRPPFRPRLPIVGDLVLVKESGEPRSAWPLARVTRIVSGKDGIPRMVEILLRKRITTRPCYLLYPLEASS